MFNWISRTIRSVFSKISLHLSHLFAKETIDEQVVLELEKLLLTADIGTKLTHQLIGSVRKKMLESSLTGTELRECIYTELNATLPPEPNVQSKFTVYLLVGINGVGKTSAAAKLADHEKKSGKTVLLGAADTFRAAATAQLQEWGKKINIPVIIGTANADPGSVVFSTAQRAREDKSETIIIDTSGRLHTKINLMKELEKLRKIILRELPNHQLITLLVIDALLGQSSANQARLFHESTPLDGIILTKLDGTGRAGAVFSIAQELKLPIWFQSSGESLEQFEFFNRTLFLESVLS